jgi:hypothetical protein
MNEDRKRFIEIQEEIRKLADEALDLMPKGHAHDFARSYWYGHICNAIGGENNPFMSDDSVSMEYSLKALPDDSDEE